MFHKALILILVKDKRLYNKMRTIDYKNLTNDELNIELKKLENEYESTKITVLKLMEKMKELDALYLKTKQEITNRNKGIFNG